jgi:DNA polymerase-3 subunit beta
MKIKILKENLVRGMELVTRVSLKKVSLPILSTCLIESEKNFIKISATNLESGIIWWGLAKVEEEGKICVDAKFFLNVISHLKEDTISLQTENNLLKIEDKNISLRIKGVNPEEFPIIPQKDSLEKISVNSEKLCQSLRRIIGIPSPSLGRPEISGILFSFEGENLKLVATDSFRLAEMKIRLPSPQAKTYSFILPHSAAKEIIGIFDKEEGEINFYLNPNQVFVESLARELPHPKILFTSKLIEGEYPNYQEIIPKKFKTKIRLGREEFLSQIKTASLFSGKINEVKLNVNKKENKVEILSQNPDYGEFKSQIFTKVEGEDISISFNYKFLIDGISSFEEKEFDFLFTDPEGPAILKPSEDYFYILMPIKAS